MDEKTITNPVKAIRAFCLECCGDNRKDVLECTAPQCSLYPFRLGKNPYRTKRELSDEQKEKMASILKEARERKAN